jgi:hypothetical protein
MLVGFCDETFLISGVYRLFNTGVKEWTTKALGLAIYELLVAKYKVSESYYYIFFFYYIPINSKTKMYSFSYITDKKICVVNFSMSV